MIKVGIIGCGAMGQEIAGAIRDKIINNFKLVTVCDLDKTKPGLITRLFPYKVAIASLPELIRESELVVECAHPDIVPEVLRYVLKYERDVMVMSTGGILDCLPIVERINKRGINIYLPSGAIAGLDAVKSAKIGKIFSVSITTRKPAKSFTGVKYLVKRNIHPETFRNPQVVFTGTAKQAIKSFPVNVNVAVTLSLAGIGPDKTKVTLIADPGINKNIHEITVVSESGTIKTVTENVPSVENPKTSRLAVFSAIATLKQINDNLRIGT